MLSLCVPYAFLMFPYAFLVVSACFPYVGTFDIRHPLTMSVPVSHRISLVCTSASAAWSGIPNREATAVEAARTPEESESDSCSSPSTWIACGLKHTETRVIDTNCCTADPSNIGLFFTPSLILHK